MVVHEILLENIKYHLNEIIALTLPMLRLLLSKTQEHQHFEKTSKPCHVGIHWVALTEYSQMSTHMPGFQSFFRFFASICIGELDSIRVNAGWGVVKPKKPTSPDEFRNSFIHSHICDFNLRV